MERIHSSGPWISQKEIDYVTDAITSGWYSNYNDYVELFEKKFAEYLGVKYAIATTNGTAALHLATSVIGLKEGDPFCACQRRAVLSSLQVRIKLSSLFKIAPQTGPLCFSG